MSYKGNIKSVVTLDGPDTPGASAVGVAVSPGSVPGTTLQLPIVPGTNALPARPATASAPSFFLATPTGNLTGAVTYVAPVPNALVPAAGGYYPGDTIRFLFTLAQLNGAGHNVTVQSATNPLAPTAIGTILQANVTTLGYIDIMLNAQGTAWVLVGGSNL